MRQPVVVGAFPEPFLHGWDGRSVRRSSKALRSDVRDRLVELVGAEAGGSEGQPNRHRSGLRSPGPSRRGSRRSGRVRAGGGAARRLVETPLPSVTGTRFREPGPGSRAPRGLAAAALLADRTISVAIIAAGSSRSASAPARTPVALSGRDARLGPRPLPVQPAGRPLRRRRLLGGTRGPRDRTAGRRSEEPRRRSSRASGSSPSGSRSPRTRCCSTSTDCCSPVGGCAALCSPSPLRPGCFHARAGRRRLRRGASGPWARRRGRARPRAAHLAARRRLARAFAQPRRVDGGPWPDGPAGRGRRRLRGARSTALRSLPPLPSS